MLRPTLANLIALQQKLPSLGRFPRTSTALSGDQKAKLKGQGMQFAGVRHYVFGDDVRHIDWRVTARTTTPHVKTFFTDRESQVIIAVDVNASMQFGTQRTFKNVLAAEVAALLAWQTHGLRQSLGSFIFGHDPKQARYRPPQRSLAAVWDLLQPLCTLDATPTPYPLAQGLQHLLSRVPQHSIVFLISDLHEHDTELCAPYLNKLSRTTQLVMVKLRDPADTDLLPLSWQAYQGPAAPLRVCGQDKATRQAYRQSWHTTDTQWQNLAKQYHIPIIDIATSDDPVTILAPALQALTWQMGGNRAAS